MGRWEPNARGRLQQAAMALFLERGYDRTTVEDIAARAGLTERTYFRYFADKREVLFSGGKALQQHLSEAVAGAPAELGPFEAVAAALAGVGAGLPVTQAHAQLRHRVVSAHPELQERELIKLAWLAAALAEALRGRGVGEPAASLAAEAGIAIFKVGFERWVADPEPHDLTHHMHAALAAFKGLLAP